MLAILFDLQCVDTSDTYIERNIYRDYICSYTHDNLNVVTLHKLMIFTLKARQQSTCLRQQASNLSLISVQYNMDGLVQDCSISIAGELEILQSGTKPWHDVAYSTAVRGRTYRWASASEM